MKLSPFPRLGSSSAALLFVASWANAQSPAAVSGKVAPAPVPAVSVTQQRVSPPDRAAEIGYFGTDPESPDGRTIAYVVYDRKPGPAPASAGLSPGGLYLCDTDLGNHRKIRDIAGIQWEDGARQIWLDNHTIAYMDYPPNRAPVTYIVNTRGEVLHGPFEACLGHGDAPDGSVPLWVDRRQYPDGSRLGSSGIYIYKAGTVSQVVNLEKDFGPLKDRLAGSDNPDEWSMFHPELSTRGTYISVRMDTKRGAFQYLVTCRSDGTDPRVFGAAQKPLHQQWYDDSTIFGHERIYKPLDGGPRNRAKRWNRDGKYIETLAGVGNHPGMSADRRYLASETMYELSPVVIRLYRTGNMEPLAVLMNEEPGPVWKMRTHVNPAFSRDGRKVYFNRPVDGMPQVHRVDISALMGDRN